MLAPTQQELIQLRNGGELDSRLVERVKEISERLNFLHWELAFPKVFSGENPGFDCVLGNPPWERIKLQEEEFFAQRDPEIANAQNKAARQKMINTLIETNPALAVAFNEAKHATECSSKFVRFSNRFPLTAVGDVNTYALFAELTRNLIASKGYLGIIIPTGIATDDTTKDFFADVVKNKSLVSLFDFENRGHLFSVLHTKTKFCLFVISKNEIDFAWFSFMSVRIEDLKDELQVFRLSSDDLELFNPNTRTVPLFRTRIDADVTKKIYSSGYIFINETTKENPWGAQFMRMFDMANDSNIFVEEEISGAIRLYEAKMFWHYDHRWATYRDNGESDLLSVVEKDNPNTMVKPRYWIPVQHFTERLGSRSHTNWLLGMRNITDSRNERSAVFSVLPFVGVGHSASVLFFNSAIDAEKISCFIANVSGIPFDYAVRQKIAGTNFSQSYVKQLPVLSPSAYTPADIDFIAPRVLELVYTANDLRPFAEDMGYHGEPFRWDEVRRAQLRAELDAYYARLYGLTRDELRYILDPKEVHGEDFPGETFRVLKEKEVRLYGEYRTSRLVLEAWDKMEG